MSERNDQPYRTSRTIGVRDLKNRLTAVVRTVREEQATYVVTLHGKPVAILRPYSEEDAAREREAQYDEALERILKLAERVDEAWHSDKSGREILAEMREESSWP